MVIIYQKKNQKTFQIIKFDMKPQRQVYVFGDATS